MADGERSVLLREDRGHHLTVPTSQLGEARTVVCGGRGVTQTRLETRLVMDYSSSAMGVHYLTIMQYVKDHRSSLRR